MMTVGNPEKDYPYAGVPWFSAVFGRDGIITALECLWADPSLARGVLQHLAETQAQHVIPEVDAETGKILHEARHGEMAALGEVPFARYYGSVDANTIVRDAGWSLLPTHCRPRLSALPVAACRVRLAMDG
jgi:glycogen debranching enzyme